MLCQRRRRIKDRRCWDITFWRSFLRQPAADRLDGCKFSRCISLLRYIRDVLAQMDSMQARRRNRLTLPPTMPLRLLETYFFKSKDAPAYRPAMQGILVVFVIMALCSTADLAVFGGTLIQFAFTVVLQVLDLLRLQRKKKKKKKNAREAAGLPRKVIDVSGPAKSESGPDDLH